MSNKSIATIGTMGIDIGGWLIRGEARCRSHSVGFRWLAKCSAAPTSSHFAATVNSGKAHVFYEGVLGLRLILRMDLRLYTKLTDRISHSEGAGAHPPTAHAARLVRFINS
jgi:hypothetical protein